MQTTVNRIEGQTSKDLGYFTTPLSLDQVRNIQKWITLLRSGNYAQGKKFLVQKGDDNVTRYCCLGVASEMIPGVKSDKNSVSALTFTYHLLGLRSPGGHDFPGMSPLIQLNDNYGWSFNDIADLLEDQLNWLLLLQTFSATEQDKGKE